MTNLSNKKCVPCEKGGVALSCEQINKLIGHIKAWTLENQVKMPHGTDTISYLLKKEYVFIDFKYAMSFVNEVADLAEFEGHHPDINLHNWNKVGITLYTHKVLSLTENDFIIATKIDQIISDNEK